MVCSNIHRISIYYYVNAHSFRIGCIDIALKASDKVTIVSPGDGPAYRLPEFLSLRQNS